MAKDYVLFAFHQDFLKTFEQGEQPLPLTTGTITESHPEAA